jgi:dienelactone hydrolase
MRRLLAAGLFVLALAGCADKAPSGAPPSSAPPSEVSAASSDAPAGTEGLAAAGATPSGKASASAPGGAAKAPTQTFAVGVSQFTFTRAGRTLRTMVLYPKAAGRFPLVLWSHGLRGSPEGYRGVTEKIAAAGFVVAAPAYPFTNDKADPFNQGDMANQPADASAVITEVLKLDAQAGSPLAGRIETGRIGAGGHSAGGYTTAGLLSGNARDARIKGAIIVAGGGMGGRFSGAATPVLFIHGDGDGTVPYTSGKSLYDACPWPKAFLTLLGGDHGAALWGTTPAATAVNRTGLDFLRYSLYGDAAARSRLRGDATVAGVAKYDGTL